MVFIKIYELCFLELSPISVTCPFGGHQERCEVCMERKVFKSKRRVEESRRLIEIYKALSSPSYILNEAKEDPLLEAFKLSQEMKNLAMEDAPFKVHYIVRNLALKKYVFGSVKYLEGNT